MKKYTSDDVAFLADEGGETIWVTDSDHCAAMAQQRKVTGDLMDELLEIHRILMCPALCEPVSESDRYTTKLLKTIIHDWHACLNAIKGREY